MVSEAFVQQPIIWKILRFVYVLTLDDHNGRYFIPISLILGMQTILLIINSVQSFKINQIKLQTKWKAIIDFWPFLRFSSNLGVVARVQHLRT